MNRDRATRWGMLALATVPVAAAIVWALSRPPDLRELADRIQAEVADIRGLEFEHPVMVQRLSPKEWRAVMDEALRNAPQVEQYWPAMRVIGIYRGPDREPWQEIFTAMRSGASGSYDARTDTLHLMTQLRGDQRDLVMAHELHHALQDQHFDVERYLLDLAEDPQANGDAVYARQAVIEGEAAFIEALYKSQYAPAGVATRERLAAVTEAELAALFEHIPAFSYEISVSPYLDGYTFIEAVQKRGWSEVDKVYRDYPPVSTEQILHPEKWFAREEPVVFKWPAFDGEPLFADWTLVLESVLGERQWRMVFHTQDLAAEAVAAAAGWNGDRFAVFWNEKTGAMLMLVWTSWDTEEDAAEFAGIYARALAIKHPGNSVPTRLERRGSTVWVVEGATPETIDGFMSFNQRAFNQRAGW